MYEYFLKLKFYFFLTSTPSLCMCQTALMVNYTHTNGVNHINGHLKEHANIYSIKRLGKNDNKH